MSDALFIQSLNNLWRKCTSWNSTWRSHVFLDLGSIQIVWKFLSNKYGNRNKNSYLQREKWSNKIIMCRCPPSVESICDISPICFSLSKFYSWMPKSLEIKTICFKIIIAEKCEQLKTRLLKYRITKVCSNIVSHCDQNLVDFFI